MLKKTWLTAALLATCSMANAAPYIGASIGKATFDDISGSIKSNTYNASEKLEVKDNESLSGKVLVVTHSTSTSLLKVRSVVMTLWTALSLPLVI